MSVQAEARVALAADIDDARLLVAWLNDIGERRNLALPPPAGNHHGALLGALFDAVSREFSDYRDVVTGARESARRNAHQLATIVRSTAEQGNMVRATAAAAQEAGHRADTMAAAADALRTYAQAAAGSANEADSGLGLIGGALGELQGRLDDGKAPLIDMRRATNGVADFLVTLARLSRHAQLLAVNASIEAAHLAEAGSRFAIVAHEVRKLSTSTRESRADVARIVGELRESTSQVTSAADESSDATSAAAAEIARAGEALSHTGRGIAKFEEMVVTVADVAATQSMALQAISTSVEQIAHHADEAATASRDAGQLDLDTLLVQANTKAGRWTLRKAGSPPLTEHDDFSRWIADLVNGGDAAAATDLEHDERFASLVAAVRALIARIDAEQREVLTDVVQVAVAVSRNGYAWRSIAQSLTGVSDEIGNVREMVSESTQGARQSSELASGMRDLVETMRSRYDGALASLEGALTRISRITSSVQEIDGFVESMNAAAARADQIMALIETLSSETDLLSLNAAIEAAHAGDLGRGFSVIAEEIRALARSTNDATVSVSQLVSSIAGIGGDLQSAIGAAAASTHDVTTSAESVRGAIAQLRSAFESAMQHALDVSNAAGGQTRALESVLENVNRAAAAFESNSTSATDKGRLELAMLGSRAHAIAARRPIGTVIERVRRFGESLCEQLEAVIESAIAGGRISLDRLFDLQYHAIAGAQIASLSRLFDTSRVPTRGFDPAKYAAPWDAAIDEAMIGVLESVYDAAAEFSPVTIFVSDLNGLFYAYPRRKIANWTNDFATDSAGNRIKRMFEDDYALRVGRWGLGPQADELGPRRTYDVFRQAGCTLSRGATRPWAGFVYARDTSMVCNEVVLALYARDMRHSTLRICYDPNVI